jgi:putative hydrolase
MGLKISIDTDAHAPGQLTWQAYGCARVAATGIGADRVVNAWSVDELLEWTASHAA